jgi:hypothetical protein
MREHSKQWTLGQLIDALEAVEDKTNAVRFDFCNMVPTTLDSYRGYYEDLALGWEPQHGYPEPTVPMLLEVLKDQIGTTVHGWKGGDYIVSRDQILFVANPGETGSTVIVGVDNGYFTVIRTVCAELGEC